MSAPFAKFYDRYPVLVQVITWIMRIFVGGLFLFSGFTKGIDVWGTIFKFKEYFNAWGYDVWEALNLVGVFALCMVEFVTGFFLVFGCFRRVIPILALIIMAFMLPLTFWLAVENPIADCGCFGDALKLTNWETFYKNVVITVGAAWLVIYNTKARALITPYLQWLGLLGAAFYIVTLSWIGYYYQPLIDFRQYKVGTNLVDESAAEEDSEDENLVFVYEKNGERKEFSINDELPDEEDGWNFVERYYKPTAEGFDSAPVATPPARQKNLRFYTQDGREDVTDDVIGEGRQLILMIPVLSEVSAAKTWKINSLYSWCKDHDVEMIATVGGNPLEIEQWKDISLAEYPIYTSDDTAIEEVVRGNPGIVYIEDGEIKWKSSLRAISIDDFQQEKIENPMDFAHDNMRIFRNISWVFLALIAFLIFLSFSPKIIMGLMKGSKEPAATEEGNKPAEDKASEDKAADNNEKNGDDE